MPRFSIIVPVYNHESYIAAALDSILAQTVGDWETVVVDDGSTDRTPHIVDGFAERDGRFKVIHKANGGVSSALNAGLEVAAGEWVLWLSSDDLFAPNKLAVHADAIDAHPTADLFFTRFRFLYEDTGELTEEQDYRTIPAPELQAVEMLRCIFVNGIAICARRSAMQAAGGFDTALRYGQDFKMWLEMMVAAPAVHIPVATCTTRQHARQVGALFSDACQFECAACCLDVLNAHGFADFYPDLDLLSSDDAVRAVNAWLDVATSPRSVVYAMGAHGEMISVLMRWLVGQPSAVRLQMFNPVLRRLLAGAASQAGTPLGGELFQAAARMLDRSNRKWAPMAAETVAVRSVMLGCSLPQGLGRDELLAYVESRGWKRYVANEGVRSRALWLTRILRHAPVLLRVGNPLLRRFFA